MTRTICLLAGLAVGLTGLAHGATYFVDDSAAGANDGSGWADAFTDLQSALDVATVGDEVWIAEGVYRPTRQTDISDPTLTTADPRDATFWIPRGVRVYGGFDGTEATLAARAGLFSSTILSGDLGVANDPTDNAYRVVFYTSVHNGSFAQGRGATLDGVVVEDANADSAVGAGVYVKSGQIGAYFYSPVFTLANCTVRDNAAANSGAGMSSGGGLIGDVLDCSFENNTSGGSGGGLFINFPESVTLIANCRFIGNTALVHGGGFARTSSDGSALPLALRMVNCLFQANAAGGRGGAIWWATNGDSASTLRMADCVVVNNSSSSYGGGLAVQPGATLPPNATIPASVAYVSSCTFADNAASTAGGAIHAGVGSGSAPDAEVSVSNSILWYNNAPTDPQINSIPTVAVVYSCVEGGGTAFGNINANPKFVDRPNLDYRILNGSPCADAGIDSLLEPDAADLDADSNTAEDLPLDSYGNARRLDAAVADTGAGTAPITDMGAHELCSGDFDLDGDTDADDVSAYLDAFSNGDLAADMNGDGTLDFFDVTAFITANSNGC